jgi:EmrB/QacA subfamily drug resistance transporter
MKATAPRFEPDPRRWWALALLCGAFFMVILDAAIVTVALPSIEEDLGFSAQGLQWVVSAYALTFAGLLLLGGRAADLLGRRRVFMVGVVLFTLASLLCGLAWSDQALIGARAFQGIGAAIMTPSALSIITTTFEEGAERNKALGIWGALGGIGATTAWLIGGPIVDGLGWEWIFFINIPVGLAALALSPLVLRESRAATAKRSYDPLGALTITGALVLLVYAVVEAPDTGWGDPQTILLLAGSAALLGAFALIEWRHPVPLVPLRIFRSRTIVGANAVMLVFGTLPYGLGFVLTLYAQQVLGYSAVKFGLTSLVFPAMAAVGSIVGQAIVLRVGFRPVAALGMALMCAGSLLLTQVSVGGSYFGDIFFGLLVFGPGVGLAFVTASIAALAGVPEHESGLASGLSNTSFQVGAALGVALVTTVAVSRTEEYLGANADANPLVALTEGFQSALLAVAILAGIGVALALLLLGRPRGVAQEQLELEPSPVPASPCSSMAVVVPNTSSLSRRARG